jgi:hypothetical protein
MYKHVSAEKTQETHFISQDGKYTQIKDYVDRQTTVATKGVQDAETAIVQEYEEMRNGEKDRLTTTKPEMKLEKMLNTKGESLSNHAWSEDEEDREDEENEIDDSELGMLSDDDEPGLVTGTFWITLQHRKESSQQQQMTLDALTQLGWVYAVDLF